MTNYIKILNDTGNYKDNKWHFQKEYKYKTVQRSFSKNLTTACLNIV